jgi:phosphoribosylglycinamide formyltransferase-1
MASNIFDHSQPPLRIAVLASGSGSNFEALVQVCKAMLNPIAEVALLIVNKPGCGAIQRAANLHVPVVLLDHRNFATREQLDQALVAELAKANVELVVMAGWMRIVTEELIRAFPQRLINIHPSLLPAFKGSGAIQQALNAGAEQSGCTIHEVVQEVDAGPILAQARVPIHANDDLASLSARIHKQEHQLLPAVVLQLALKLKLQAQG